MNTPEDESVCVDCGAPEEGEYHGPADDDEPRGRVCEPMCTACGQVRQAAASAAGRPGAYVRRAERTFSAEVWPPQLWPDACPRCGKPSDEMGYWYAVEPPTSEGMTSMALGRCWDCNEPHPVLGKLQPPGTQDVPQERDA